LHDLITLNHDIKQNECTKVFHFKVKTTNSVDEQNEFEVKLQESNVNQITPLLNRQIHYRKNNCLYEVQPLENKLLSTYT